MPRPDVVGRISRRITPRPAIDAFGAVLEAAESALFWKRASLPS